MTTKPYELSSAERVDDEATFVERARETFRKLQTIDPDQVVCMLGIVVTEVPNSDGNMLTNAFVLGTDENISRMFSSLIEVTRNGITQAESTPDPDEVKH